MNEIYNDDGDLVTRINVMQLFSYDVAEIADTLSTLANAFGDSPTVTLHMVLDRVQSFCVEDFGPNAGALIFQDQNGGDL